MKLCEEMKDELAVRDESDSIEALISICSDNHFRESRDDERDGCFEPPCFVPLQTLMDLGLNERSSKLVRRPLVRWPLVCGL